MPILRRRTNSATTTQPAGTGAVPGQRDTQEGVRQQEDVRQQEGIRQQEGVRQQEGIRQQEPAGYGGGEGSRGTGTASPTAQAGYRQTEGRRAGAQPYGEGDESRLAARRRHYGMPATLMLLSGMLTFFIGITGIIRGVFFNNVATYPFYFSVRSRGVLLLVIGALAFLTGLALLARVRRAREVAIVIAVASAVANFMFLPFYPFWSVIVLVLDVIILWELTREDRREFARFLPSRGLEARAKPPVPGTPAPT